MSPSSTDRVRESYRQLAPTMCRVTQVFYDRLFQLHPEVRSLFKIDMTQQGQHLAAALALIVVNLPVPDALEGPVRELGGHHVWVGVRAEHYPIRKDIMLSSLATVAAGCWTDALAADWA